MLSVLSPALAFLTPLWGLALALRYKPALVSCLAILSFSLLAIASGSLQLVNARKADLVVQTCLYAHLGASMILLTHRYKGYSLILIGFLVCATILGSISPFVHAIPTIIPPLLFLFFTLSTLPLLAHSLLLKSRTIPVITRVPIPPPLPSPAASSIASFPSSSDKQHELVSSCLAYKDPPLASTESASTAADVVSSIRHRAQIIRTRSRNIIVILLISQLFALLSNTLLLVLALTHRSQVVKSIQTLFLVLSMCGFMLAFSLHGHTLPIRPSNTPPSTRISISVSISKRQDQPNSTFLNSNSDQHAGSMAHTRAKLHGRDNIDGSYHHRGVNVGDHPPHSSSWKDDCPFSQPSDSHAHTRLGLGLGLSPYLRSASGDGGGVGRLERFQKIFGMKGGPGVAEEGVISLKNLHHPQNSTTQNQCHTRFASSSFSSSPRYNENKSHSSSHSQSRVGSNDIQSHVVDISRPDEGKDEEKNHHNRKEDKELPVLPMHTCSSIGQLPSPPDTPRTRIHSSTTRPLPHPHPKSHHPTTYYQQPNHTISSSSSTTIPATDIAIATAVNNAEIKEENEQVRIGMVTPAERPNLTIRDIFVDTEQYEDVCERGEVIDSAVSEPGHGSRGFSPSPSPKNERQYFDFGRPEDVIMKENPKSPRAVSPSFSTPAPTPTPTPNPIPIPSPVLRSPTFSNPSSWMTRTTSNFKRPIKSRSMMSLSLSFGSGSGSADVTTRSPRSPTLPWMRADKLKERLKRPLRGHGRTVSLSQPPTLRYSAGKEQGLDFVSEEEGKEENAREKDKGKGLQHHKRTGSTWSSVIQKSPAFAFSSIVPTMATTTNATSSSEWEWYPSLSKAKSKSKSKVSTMPNPHHQGEVLTPSISNKKKREQTGTPLLTVSRPSLSDQQHPISDTADFVDLTDPFASPTPGFALPKWVGNNGSSITAGSGASASIGPYGLGIGGSASDVGHGGYASGGGASSSWCHDSGNENYREAYVNEEKEASGYTTMVWKVPKAAKSKSSVQWGKLPPVPPLPPSSLSDQGHDNYDGLKKKRERLETATTMKRTRPGRRRPDSPMPMKTSLSGATNRALMQVVDDVEDENEDRTVIEGEISERPGSPVPPSPSSPLTLTTAIELGRELEDTKVLKSVVVVRDDVEVSGAERLQRKRMNTTTDPNTLNNINSSKGGGSPNSRVKPRRARNGSPVPIPFRRNKSHRRTTNSNTRVLDEEKEREDPDMVDGLNLEEVLLAQRLLRRLNSDEGDSGV